MMEGVVAEVAPMIIGAADTVAEEEKIQEKEITNKTDNKEETTTDMANSHAEEKTNEEIKEIKQEEEEKEDKKERELCGFIGKTGKPCQRTAACPFHTRIKARLSRQSSGINEKR